VLDYSSRVIGLLWLFLILSKVTSSLDLMEYIPSGSVIVTPFTVEGSFDLNVSH